MWKAEAVHLTDSEGRILNANYTVEADSHGLSVILESAGGRTADGGSRNPDYRKALRLLLERLRDRKAVLVRAVIDSSKLTSLPETDRTVLEGPVVLVEQPDLDRVRLRLTASQARLAKAPRRQRPATTANGCDFAWRYQVMRRRMLRRWSESWQTLQEQCPSRRLACLTRSRRTTMAPSPRPPGKRWY